MYELARGPLLWISAVLFVAGLAYRTVRLFRLTERRAIARCPAADPKPKPASARSPEERKLEQIARFQNSILGKHPVMTIVSAVFHVCLFAAPLLLLAHNLMLRNALGVRLPSLPDGLADFLTLTVLGLTAFFLVRRIAVPKVAAISEGSDYAALLIIATPYLTGFIARHQLLNYHAMLTVHILTGELMLIAIPFTKIGHMAFFFFSRLTMAGEFCLGRGGRTWAAPER